jgi:membrane dipeptidase
MVGFDRRWIVRAGIAGLATQGFGGVAAARAPGKTSSWDHGLVINGNLIAPTDPDGPLDKPLARQITNSGLTAFKLTIGGSQGSYADTLAQVEELDLAMDANAAVYMKIKTTDDLETAQHKGRVGVIYSFESVEMLEGRLDRIDEFYGRGIRVMQLGYNTTSPFASGCLTSAAPFGLSDLGREAIGRMNSLGVTLDLSHADEPSALQAVAESQVPSLITHAGCHTVYAHPRNKPDSVLRAVAERGGVVGIYELSYLSAGPNQQSLGDYLAHLEHALKVCGEDHVGIGSDAILTPFDTSPAGMADWNRDIAERKRSGVAAPGEGRPPFVQGLNRVDRTKVIARALTRKGYPARVVGKVLGANFQRVFAETWKA